VSSLNPHRAPETVVLVAEIAARSCTRRRLATQALSEVRDLRELRGRERASLLTAVSRSRGNPRVSAGPPSGPAREIAAMCEAAALRPP
jgi:hypothetical protein